MENEEKLQEARRYLEKKEIAKLFECLMSTLIMHKPDDPVDFLMKMLTELESSGGDISAIGWESFIAELHPRRDATRLSQVKDSSDPFFREYAMRNAIDRPSSSSNAQPSTLFQLTELRK